jgi:nitrate/nitrite-specific signal transduction histidine kinase
MKINPVVKNYRFPISLMVLFSILIYTGYYFSSIQKDDGLRINLSGRQRMLTQKITKEILLYKIGEISPDSIKKSLEIFTETENALIKGGQAPLDMESENYRILPETDHKASLEKLLEVKSEWESIEKKIIEYIKTRDESSLKYIIAHNETLLKKIDDSVYALQLRSEKNNMIIRIIIICSFIMISALLIININKRIKELRSAADRIKELENLLPICSSCKKIRTDNDNPMKPESWTTIEEYLHVNKDMLFTHSICPDCIKKLYPGMIEGMKK